MSAIVGIDLGTTNSLVGCMEAGFPILCADADGERLTPSVVHFPASPASPVVGRAAQRLRALAPEATVFSVKRLIGRRVGEEEAEVGCALAGRPGGPVKLAVGGREWLPEEVSALVLGKLKADAERALGCEVSRAVITVPAYFNDAQRQATLRAGELAGLKVERILNEPTAAALAYGVDRLGERAKIAVFDLGGGTFDLSVLELSAGVFQVLSTQGNTRLGGDDLDRRVEQWIVEGLKADGLADDARWAGDGELRARVRERAVEAKHRLSAVEEVGVELPFVDGTRSFSRVLSRAELEAMAARVFEPVREHCLRALSDARLRPDELGAVILVGGMTRMPLVRRMVAEIFGREADTSQNPDEAVALGATLQAGILSGSVRNVVLLDVTPLSLGIETFGGLMNVIIPRNSTIPTKAGEMFTNAVAGQRLMRIHVLQGEREMVRDNWSLGQFDLEFEPSPKAQARVGVQFEIDANGILHVLARDTKTGREQRVQMASAVDVSDEAVEKMLEDSLEHAFEDMNERAFTEAQMKSRDLLAAVRLGLEKAGALLREDEGERIAQLMRAVEEAAGAGASGPLKKAMAALDDATQPLAALLVEQAMGPR